MDGFPGVEKLKAAIEQEQKESKRNSVNLLSLVSHINSTPAWEGALRFNLLTEGYEVCGPFPPLDGSKERPRPLEDPRDILRATMYFQANGFPKAVKASVTDAISAVAQEHSYHPVRDYLNRLKWDGVERVGNLFQKYYKAELPADQKEQDRQVAYLKHVSIGFMVGAVARVMNPGCKHDHVPVLVSNDQGLLKSSSILALCADPAWFSDNLPPDLADRDTKEFLRGKWLIELSEIPHVRREVERVKAFVASSNDRYRAAYGRFNQDHPRQCAFIGTSNDLEFADVTGNRRFWPFRVKEAIDVEGIIRDRDQLWAEAADMYRRGVKWWLPPDIEKIAAERQAAFVEDDLWDDLISDWLTNHPGPFTMEDLFGKDTGITPYRDTAATPRADEMRAGRCLKRLGWYKDRCTLNGTRAVWWQRKSDGDQSPF
jgi:virulence-associated protein E